MIENKTNNKKMMEEDGLKKITSLKKRTTYFLRSLMFLSIASILVFIGILHYLPETSKKTSQKLDRSVFENISIKAESAVVYDITNKQFIFSKEADIPKPLASLTKVMTALVAYELLPKHSRVDIIEDYMAPEGDSGLANGDSWTFENLVDFTLVTSSNDGAHALASVAQASSKEESNNFIKEMNRTAEKIGMMNSKFFNEHGLDRTAERGGAYGSARDVATLFEYIIKNNPEILEATRYQNLSISSKEKKYHTSNTNAFVDQIPWIIASKTGYTDLAGGNLAVAFDAGLNRPIIIVVLGSTQEERFSDTITLVNTTMDFINEEYIIER